MVSAGGEVGVLVREGESAHPVGTPAAAAAAAPSELGSRALPRGLGLGFERGLAVLRTRRLPRGGRSPARSRGRVEALDEVGELENVGGGIFSMEDRAGYCSPGTSRRERVSKGRKGGGRALTANLSKICWCVRPGDLVFRLRVMDDLLPRREPL